MLEHYANILVNYIEIFAPLSKAARKRSFTAVEAMPILGTVTNQADAQGTENLLYNHGKFGQECEHPRQN